MATINDGGPAFPTAENVSDPRNIGVNHVNGMTLRDYFAGQALSGWMATYGDSSIHPCDPDHGDRASVHAKNIANDAYLIADAMIAARAVIA